MTGRPRRVPRHDREAVAERVELWAPGRRPVAHVSRQEDERRPTAHAVIRDSGGRRRRSCPMRCPRTARDTQLGDGQGAVCLIDGRHDHRSGRGRVSSGQETEIGTPFPEPLRSTTNRRNDLRFGRRLVWTRYWSPAAPASSLGGAWCSRWSRDSVSAPRYGRWSGSRMFVPRSARWSTPCDRLRVVAADLTSDEGWSAAVAGCRYVLHPASPLGGGSAGSMLAAARDGALRVL